MAVRAPAPQNQFYRLEKRDGVWVKTTRWDPVAPSFDSVNCMATLGAIALDAHSGGSILTTPPGIRSRQFDQSGGIGVDDVKVAWDRGWNQTLLTPAYFDWADTIAAVRDGRFAIIGVDYDQVPYAYRAQKTYLGDHAMGIDYIYADGSMRVWDSLATNYARMPQYAVRLGAEKLAVRVRGTKGALFVGLTRQRATINLNAGWGADVPSSIRTGASLTAVRAAIRKAGLNYGTLVNMVDLRAALRRARIDYGTSVQLIDVKALLRWAA